MHNRTALWYVCRHAQEQAEHDAVAAQLESARSKFKEFERKDVKARLCPLWNGANDGKSVLPNILLFHQTA